MRCRVVLGDLDMRANCEWYNDCLRMYVCVYFARMVARISFQHWRVVHVIAANTFLAEDVEKNVCKIYTMSFTQEKKAAQ